MNELGCKIPGSGCDIAAYWLSLKRGGTCVEDIEDLTCVSTMKEVTTVTIFALIYIIYI